MFFCLYKIINTQTVLHKNVLKAKCWLWTQYICFICVCNSFNQHWKHLIWALSSILAVYYQLNSLKLHSVSKAFCFEPKFLKILNFMRINLNNFLFALGSALSFWEKILIANQLIPIVHHKHEIINVHKWNLNEKKRKDYIGDRFKIFEIILLLLSIYLIESDLQRLTIFHYQRLLLNYQFLYLALLDFIEIRYLAPRYR